MNPAREQIKVRILILAGICMLFAGALFYRFYTVQIIRHDELLKKALKSYTSSTGQKRQRGKILDRNGEVFAGNLPKISVSCSPYSIVDEPFVHLEKSLKAGVRESLPRLREKRRRAVAEILASTFGGKSAGEYYRELAPWEERNGKKVKRNYLVIDKAADPKAVRKFKEAMAAEDLHLGGFVFDDIYVRYYPKGRMLANVIGFANVGRDGTMEHGGLEKALGANLRAEDSSRTIQRSGDGSQLAYGDHRVDVAGHDGDDIYLTISEPVQAILEDELDKVVEEHHPWRVYAIIVEPSTGNILAMSQRPNFDPQDMSTAKEFGFANAIAGNAYEPGSVMKPFFIAKAIDEGVITPESVIDCGNSSKWYYGGFPLNDPRGYGMMTPGGILKKSSNIGTAKVALMMGDDMVWQTLHDFKFGKVSGLPFSPESRGILPRFPFRDKVTITRVPIGYAEQVTILQLARAYCAIANRGKMPHLRLLDRRLDAKSGKIVEYPFLPQEQILKHPETFDHLREMLISVTAHDGTGKRAAIPGYEVAGKTGTSSVVINKVPSKEWYRASFCGFVPARDPKLVMVITVEGLHASSNKYGGGAVAAPVFNRAMSRVLRLHNIQPDFPEQLKKAK